jgi:hypothetical protein
MAIVHPPKLISNFNPVSDICIGSTTSDTTEETLFAACGDKNFGSVNEIHGALDVHNVFMSQEFDYFNQIWCFKMFDKDLVLFLSSPCSSRMLSLQKDRELIDISDRSGIQQGERTVFFSPLPDFAMLQVLCDRVTVQLLRPLILQAKMVKSCPIPGVVTFASLCCDFVILVTSHPNAIIILKILSDLGSGVIQIDIITKLDIPHEVSSLSCPKISGLPPICIFGMYDCAVVIVTLDDLLASRFPHDVQPFPITINHIEFLDTSTTTPTLVCGTRSGALYVVTMEQDYALNVISMTEIGTLLCGLKSSGPGQLLAICSPRSMLVRLQGLYLEATPIRSKTLLDAAVFYPLQNHWLFLSGNELTCNHLCSDEKWLANRKVVGTVKLN